MSAIAIIEQLESQGVTLWSDDDGIHYKGDMSVVTQSVIEQMREYKADIIKALSEPSANDEPLPVRWGVALSILDDMTAEKRSIMVYDKAPVNIQRRDWRRRYQIALSLNDWETERLEQDLRANKWVYFNNMYETVERTTPEYEAKASEFIAWAGEQGIKHLFLTIPTGIVNHGRSRTLPANTVKGLDDYINNYG